jgi:hypothetical protein
MGTKELIKFKVKKHMFNYDVPLNNHCILWKVLDIEEVTCEMHHVVHEYIDDVQCTP